MTHTPGPWSENHPYSTPDWQAVPAGNGHGPFNYASLGIGAGQKLLAEVRAQTDGGGYPQVDNLDEMRANARLIASAPDLLDALASAPIVGPGETINEFRLRQDAWLAGQYRAAVAKATGVA